MAETHPRELVGLLNHLRHAYGSSILGLGLNGSVDVSGREKNVLSILLDSLFSPSSYVSDAAGSPINVGLELCIRSRTVKSLILGIYRRASSLDLASAVLGFLHFFSSRYTKTASPILVLSPGYQPEAYSSAFFSSSSDNKKYHQSQKNGRVYHNGDEGGPSQGVIGGDVNDHRPEPEQHHGDLYFACPFSKHDDWRCYRKYGLKRLGDVLDHIKRVHTTSIYYCAFCSKEFEDREPWETHCSRSYLYPGSCERGQNPELIAWDTYVGIRDVVSRATGSGREKWNELYSCIFPYSPLPTSPYWKLTFDDPLELMREHAFQYQGSTGNILGILRSYQIPVDEMPAQRRNALVAALINDAIPLSAAEMANQKLTYVQTMQPWPQGTN